MDDPNDPNAALLRLQRAHRSAMNYLMEQAQAQIEADYRAAIAAIQDQYQKLLTQYALDLAALRKRLDDELAHLPQVWLTNNGEALRALEQAIAARISAFGSAAQDMTEAAQAVAAPLGESDALALLNQALSPVQNAGLAMQLLGHSPNPDAISQLINAASNGQALGQLFDGFGAEAAAAARAALSAGLALGDGPLAMASALQDALGISRDRALTIARTETLGAYRAAQLQTYRANSDVVKGWIWIAAQSGNTCAACLFMDGTFHTLDESMSFHISCRCTQAPATSSWADILGPLGLDQSVIDSIGETSLAADGTYFGGADWFATAGEDVQRAVLGPAKYEAFAQGDITLEDLVGVHHDAQWGDSIYEKSLKELGLKARDYLTRFEASPISRVSQVVRDAAAAAADARAAKEAAQEAAKADWEAEHVANLARGLGVEPPPLYGRGEASGASDLSDWEAQRMAAIDQALGEARDAQASGGAGDLSEWEQWYHAQIQPLLPEGYVDPVFGAAGQTGEGLDSTAFSVARVAGGGSGQVYATYDLTAEDQAFAAQLKNQIAQLDQSALAHTDAIGIGGQLHDRIESGLADFKAWADEAAQMRQLGPNMSEEMRAWAMGEPEAKAAHGGVSWVSAEAKYQAEYQARVSAYLSEMRDMGGELHVEGAVEQRIADALDRVQGAIPSDWIQASNDQGGLAFIKNRERSSAGWYMGAADRSGGGTIALSYTRTSNDVALDSTALHEYMHRMEDVIPQLSQLQADFYEARTAGDALVQLTNGIDMQTRLDQWVDEYLGRVPFDTPLGNQSYELLSIGAEAALGGGSTYDMIALRQDKEFMSFILGLLAIVRADGGGVTP